MKLDKTVAYLSKVFGLNRQRSVACQMSVLRDFVSAGEVSFNDFFFFRKKGKFIFVKKASIFRLIIAFKYKLKRENEL